MHRCIVLTLSPSKLMQSYILPYQEHIENSVIFMYVCVTCMFISNTTSHNAHIICNLNLLCSCKSRRELRVIPTSLVVWAFRIRSRQMGHMSSLCNARGDIAIFVVSDTISCGFRWSS